MKTKTQKAASFRGRVVRRFHYETTSTDPTPSLEAIEFMDGTFVRFNVIEGDEYGLRVVYPARSVKGGK